MMALMKACPTPLHPLVKPWLCAALLCASLATQPLAAQPPPGAAKAAVQQVLVRQVLDGDTLVVQAASGPPLTLRLRQIDAPEICQAWGVQARDALTELALGKLATLRLGPPDRQGAHVGQLLINEIDLGRAQVENGHAWSLRTRYDQGPLVKQERMARALSRGLHGQVGAVPPWDFRRAHLPCPKS